MPCPYAHSLGVPGQGVHAAGIGGYSLNDILGTIGLAVTTAYFTHTGFFLKLLAWLVLAEFLHYVFGTQTAFLTTLGIKACHE